MTKYDQPIGQFCKSNLDIRIALSYEQTHYSEFLLALFEKLMRPQDNVVEVDGLLTKKISCLTGWDMKYIGKVILKLERQGFFKRESRSKLRMNPFYCNKKDRVPNNFGYIGKSPSFKSETIQMITKLSDMFHVPHIDRAKDEEVTMLKRQVKDLTDRMEAIEEILKENGIKLPPKLRLVKNEVDAT